MRRQGDLVPETKRMSQATANPQHEPTMEEILASIRKIISEDQPAEGGKASRAPALPPQRPMLAVPEPVAAKPVAPPAPPAELDVLDLTEEVHDEDDEPAPATSAPAPVIENDVI